MEKLKFNIADEIVKNNFKRELNNFSENACRSSKAFRFYDNNMNDRTDIRGSYFHDIDRILHSGSYSKYIDKTQVFYLFENDLITHRVLHVQLVSKIARTIGRSLRLNEDLIEAIALGHDLGHAPYGHNGEKCLNKLCEDNDIGCFIHNAQSFRFLHEIENKGKGLNLTAQTLDGILCHNGELLNKEYRPNLSKKPDNLIREYNRCFKEKGYDKKLVPMTMEGCIVRLSDVIAYIGRDVQDAVTLKFIKWSNVPKRIRNILGENNSEIINTLVMDVINNSFGKDFIGMSDRIFERLNELMKFNYEVIYNNKIKMEQDSKIENIFYELFEIYLNELNNGNSKYIERWAKEKVSVDYFEKTDNKRIVIDYMAGMTDDFILKTYKEYKLPQSFGYSIKK